MPHCIVQSVFFVRDCEIEEIRLADLLGGRCEPFSHLYLGINTSFLKVLPQYIEGRRNDENQKRIGNQFTEPLCALHVNPHHNVLAFGQGVTHLFFRDAIVVVVHLCPFQQLFGCNHVDEIFNRDEMVIYSVLLAGSWITCRSGYCEVDTYLAGLDHAVDHHIFTDAGRPGDHNYKCIFC